MNTNKISIWHRHSVMEHQHSIDFYFVVSSILLRLSFLKTEPNWLNLSHRLDYFGERNGTCSEYKTINFKGNRPSAWWRHFTTMTRILQGFAFLCKLELLLFKAHWDYQILNLKEKTKRILVVVVKWRYRTNGLFEFEREVFSGRVFPPFRESHLNYRTIEFRLQTQKLKLHTKYIVPCESTAKEVVP